MAPRELSDDEVFGGVAGKVWTAAEKYGVDPAFALRVANQESRLNQRARSPAGAIGVMQLMPGTAGDLGVNPYDEDQNIDGGVRYLAQQMEAFGDPRLAAAAYNAGPGRVRRAGKVPDIPETRDYVDAVAGNAGAPDELTDEEVFGAATTQVAPRQTPPRGSPRKLAGKTPTGEEEGAPPPPPSVLEDAWSGFWEPIQGLRNDAEEIYRRRMAEAKAPPPTPAEALERAKAGFMDVPRLAGGAIAALGAPVQAAIRPTARAINTYLPARPHEAPKISFRGGLPQITPSRPLYGEEAQAHIEGALNTALQGGRAAGVNLSPPPGPQLPTKVPGRTLTEQVRAVAPQMPVPRPKPRPMSPTELKAADDAAWARVDASGYRFPKKDLKAMAADVQRIVKEAGPELYQESARIAARIERMAKGGTLTPSQANRLRSQVGEKLLQPGSTEASVGSAIKARIDALIDTANDPNLAAARDLHTRLRKVQEVNKRVEAGNLRAATTYAGGNKANAVRQSLRPLIDPKSPQRIRNLTPAETKALNKVVRGTPGANAARVTGKLLDPRGLLGVLAQSAGVPLTGGLSLAAAAPGVAASELSNALTLRAVDKLVDLISSGGKPAPKRAIKPRGLIGSGVVAAPAARRD